MPAGMKKVSRAVSEILLVPTDNRSCAIGMRVLDPEMRFL